MSSLSSTLLPRRLDLGEGTTIHSFGVVESSYLIVRHGRSLLVECHSNHLRHHLERLGLPLPELILHTHVQPEHCREGTTFGDAVIRVPYGQEVLASDPQLYRRLSVTVWEQPEKWGETAGAEPFGTAGSVSQFPPLQPLRLGESLAAHGRVQWEGLLFEIIPLPAHGGRHAIGFLLRGADGAILGLFTGDLLRHPACLVNMYDLEYAYGRTCLDELPVLLRWLANLGAKRFFPSTGPILLDGPAQARRLADKIDLYLRARRWESGDFTPAPLPPTAMLGRWHRVHDGVYQFRRPGNPILFIDGDGRGMMVDPGPCEYEDGEDRRRQAFLADLDLFEAEAGLKTVDLILITHFHGDHFDLTPELRARYGSRVAAWDLVARVIEAPWDYPYAAKLPWYNLGFDTVHVDDVTILDAPYYWHDVRIDSVHLPGHCLAHGGYILDFNGKRFAITGDTVQNHGESSTLDFIMANHSVPGSAEGNLGAFEALAGRGIDINLGGHGSRFVNCDALYRESIRRIEHATARMAVLIPDGDFDKAFRRPSYPRIEPYRLP